MSSVPESSRTPVRWTDFLSKYAPPVTMRVSGAYIPTEIGEKWHLSAPPIEIHCASEHCGGVRVFEKFMGQPGFGSILEYLEPLPKRTFLTYQCRNCKQTQKTYAVLIQNVEKETRILTSRNWANFHSSPQTFPLGPSRSSDRIGNSFSKDLEPRGRVWGLAPTPITARSWRIRRTDCLGNSCA